MSAKKRATLLAALVLSLLFFHPRVAEAGPSGRSPVTVEKLNQPPPPEEIAREAETVFKFKIHPSLPIYVFHVYMDPESLIPQRIEISKEGDPSIIQTLTLSVPEPTGIEALDMNFDGYLDIRLLVFRGATGNVGFIHWLFDKEKGIFVSSEELDKLANASPIPETKTLATHWNLGGAGGCYERELYKWENGRLVLVRSEKQDWTGEGNYWRRITWKKGAGVAERIVGGDGKVELQEEILALAIDPTNPATVYAGTGRGIFKSTDGGANWAATGLTDNVNALALDPKTPTTLYAGSKRALFKSTDGGRSWTAIKTVGNDVSVLAIDPNNPETIYAGIAADSYGLIPDSSIFKSTDGGRSWTAIDNGLTDSPDSESISALALDPKTPTTLYAGTSGCGVFKSTDGGANWTAISTGLSRILPPCPPYRLATPAIP